MDLNGIGNWLKCFLGCVMWTMAVSANAADRPPNFVVIFCDNLGYGDIEPFGATSIRTPNLNRMAREGKKLTHFCVTAGVCTPSRASLMTGCYSQRVGMHDNPRDGQVLRPLSPYGLAPSEITLAEVLKRKDYATAIIGKWHLGDQLEFFPTRQGFDTFYGIPYSDDMTEAVGERVAERFGNAAWPPLPLLQDETVIEAPADRNELTKRYTQRAIEFMTEKADQPFFLYLPQAMPGSTSQPFASAEFRGRSQAGPWGDSVEELDWSTGEILDAIVDLGIAEHTLVIWTSDNGAPMASRPSAPFRGSNAPLHGRGYTTSEGAFRVPTIAWWPSRIKAGTECHTLCTTMDLLPTFASLADVAVEHAVDGHDITSVLLSDHSHAASPYKAFFYYERDQLQAVRQGPWKLFVPLPSFTRHPHFKKEDSSKPLLFNVVEDIACEQDLAGERSEIVARLTRLAEQARQDLGDRGQPGAGQRPGGKILGEATPRVMNQRESESKTE